MIRPGKEEDIDQAIDLVREFCEESLGEYGYHIEPDAARQTFKQFVDHSLVIEEGGRILGVIAGYVSQNAISRQMIYHEQLWYVLRDHRRKGIALLEAMEKRCCDQGISFFIMGCMGNSMFERLDGFYKKRGYKFLEAHYIKEL